MNCQFEVIDTHQHLFPGNIAATAVPMLAERFGNAPAFDGTVSGSLAVAAEAGISAVVNLPVATKPGAVRNVNKTWVVHAKLAATSPCVVSLAAFHPLLDEKGSEIEWIARAGFAGVKFHPDYQLFRYNDPCMDEVWAAMSEFGLVAYLHAGGERVFKPPYHSTPEEIALLLRRFPKLRVAAAHLGGFGMWDDSERALAGTRAYLDLSHTFFWMPHEQILHFIRRHGAGRILFGTDAPWQSPPKVLEAFLSLPLDDDSRAAILSANARDLFSLRTDSRTNATTENQANKTDPTI